MVLNRFVTGTTKMLALVGNPVEHTLSPFIHNTLSRELGRELIYVPFRGNINRLDYMVEAFRELMVVGFNVTVPFKRDIMKYIDDNSREAILMGAVNTVKMVENRLCGFNTDAAGFLRALKDFGGTCKGKSVVIIGAGGSARAIGVKLAMENVGNLRIINRTLSNADDLASIINENIENIASAYSLDSNEAIDIIKESDIVINTTNVGLYPYVESAPIKDVQVINSNHFVYDIIYNPFETKLLKEARKRGATTLNGLGMLVHQAILAYEIWTGEIISKELSDQITKNIKKLL